MTGCPSLWFASVLALMGGLFAGRQVNTQGGGAPRFEVASVRLNTAAAQPLGGGSGGPAIAVRGNRFTATGATLRELIRYAYHLEPLHPIDGGPRWLDEDRFDIAAVLPEPASTDPARRMLQTLLAERFHLVVRFTEQEQPVYALQFARRDRQLGPALKPSSVDCDVVNARRERDDDGVSSVQETLKQGELKCDIVIQPFRASIRGSARPITDLARTLSRVPAVGMPVVDRTGLTGNFDFEIVFSANPVNTAPNGAPSVFVALEEQLGLRLQRTRGPGQRLVVADVERLAD